MNSSKEVACEVKGPKEKEQQKDVIQLFYESNAGDGTTTFDQHLGGMKLLFCLVACYLSTFLIQLDQTIVVTILETVGNKFNAFEQVGWISSGYMLAMCVFSVTWGRLSIVFGRKWSLVIAVALFEVGSLICALSQNMNTLIGGRVLAGVGGGGVQTLTMIIASELTPIDKRPLIIASFGITAAISTVSGPLVGGAFSNNGLWRWCFFINLPLGGLAIAVLILAFNPPMPKFSLKQKFMMIDYIGTALLSAGIVLLLLGMTCGGNEFKWKSAAIILFFIIGACCLVGFGVWNNKFSPCPIIPPSVIKTPRVILAATMGGLVFFCFMGSLVYVTVFFQVIKRANAWKAGVSLIPLVISTIFSSIISSLLTKKIRSIKLWALAGTVCGSVGYGLLSLLNYNSPSSQTIGFLILPGIYTGVMFQILMLSSHIEAPKQPGSMILVTALMNFARSLGGALGADIEQLVFNNSFKTMVSKALESARDTELTASDSILILSKPGLLDDYNESDKALLFDSFVESFQNVCYLACGVACLSFLSALCMSNKKLPNHKEIAKAPNGAISDREQEDHVLDDSQHQSSTVEGDAASRA